MIYKAFLLIFPFSLLAACQQAEVSPPAAKKTITIGRVMLELPPSYQYVKGKGVDSYVAYILNEKKDTFEIEYGKPGIIYQLFDTPPVVVAKNMKEKFEKNFTTEHGPDEVVYTNTPSEDNAEGIFLKNYYRYDTVGGLVVRIVQPKRIGDGMTGMVVQDLPDSNYLSIFAKNLDSTHHKAALDLYHTVKLK
ncbi:MAG TPA: hypothetical protein VHC48_23025 [Puia sp.]|jgi:hypothetical protein|nr:hypothetical protein [Puia sp.]